MGNIMDNVVPFRHPDGLEARLILREEADDLVLHCEINEDESSSLSPNVIPASAGLTRRAGEYPALNRETNATSS